jgi:outer membrane protein W
LAILRSVAAALVAFLVAGQARAADAGATGIELGLRTGYAFPFGSFFSITRGAAAPSLADKVDGIVPIWLDAGYRFTPNLYVGADFQYGVGVVNSGPTNCRIEGVSCAANNIMVGVGAHYHARPDKKIDPWVGIGAGYETFSFTTSFLGQTGYLQGGGFQLFDLQLGADYKATPSLGLGPFAMVGLGQFSSCSASGTGVPATCAVQQPTLHEWLTLGVRAAFDVHFGR